MDAGECPMRDGHVHKESPWSWGASGDACLKGVVLTRELRLKGVVSVRASGSDMRFKVVDQEGLLSGGSMTDSFEPAGGR
mmetsp:Transcript_79576/g.257807  ORF Transcript_79576/g.257807 Transcript_79576/m.257807 type:complete len:80 (-) Transcript_79576:75-314(-)